MDKTELTSKIKSIVKQVYSSTNKISLDEPPVISLDNFRFPILQKFPQIQKVLVDLLSDQYDLFLKDIQWVAPKPTTFRIILANDKEFYLIYTERTWIVKVEGKKYYMLNINEAERATEVIARILSYGNKEMEDVKKESAPKDDTAKEESPEPESPEELKEIDGETEETLNKAFLIDLLGPEKLSKLKNFGANKKSWISIHHKIADKLGIDINQFYENNLEEKVRDIISR